MPTKPSEFLKNDLNKAKIQLEHLNELLNESELNNVRLTEQINVLKEEIRRFLLSNLQYFFYIHNTLLNSIKKFRLERNQEREKRRFATSNG